MAVGIIGSGSFGLTMASLLSENDEVLIYGRTKEKIDLINQGEIGMSVSHPDRIKATTDLEEVCNHKLLFPVLPSKAFRTVMRQARPYLTPAHILIHGTKGLDVNGISDNELLNSMFHRNEVHTMSEIIRQETSVVRVGCVSGPNLSSEIKEGQPAATVIASEFDEVLRLGTDILSSNRFFVFGGHDLKGVELAGAYKNIIAIASGILSGKKYGKNMQSMLINRGLHEMINFGTAMGSTSKAFLGAAGIGDLVATATSENSRNFTFGRRLGQGEKMQDILNTSDEIVEGVRTLKIIKQLADNDNISLPITELTYKVVFHNFNLEAAIRILMNYSGADDVDFL
jgi:glycerol-3-phosphate dehydrogenase (NAD(P)+)